MPALPNLVRSMLTKLLLIVVAAAVGIAAASILYKFQNPDASLTLNPFDQPSPSPSPSPQQSPTSTSSPATTTTTVPSDWKTYTNEILGFEFQYPPEIILSEEDLLTEAIESAYLKPAEYDYAVTLSFTESAYIVIASSVNVRDEYKPVDPLKTAQDLGSSLGEAATISDTILGGKNAHKVVSSQDPVLVFFVLAPGKNTDSSEISISAVAEKDKEAIINQILDSFKFLP